MVKSMANQSPALDGVFRALADPVRRSILAQLCAGPASVSELARPLDMSLPAVMQHLAVLEETGLMRSQKVGRVRTCEVQTRALRAAEEWLGHQRTAWEVRLDRLEQHLSAVAPQNPDKES